MLALMSHPMGMDRCTCMCVAIHLLSIEELLFEDLLPGTVIHWKTFQRYMLAFMDHFGRSTEYLVDIRMRYHARVAGTVMGWMGDVGNLVVHMLMDPIHIHGRRYVYRPVSGYVRATKHPV